MTRYTSYSVYTSFFKYALVALLAFACRPASDESPECDSDSQCFGAQSKCLDEVCVECIVDQDCECYEICSENNICEVLGATTDTEAPNAHGNWSTTPSNPDYSFLSYCERDNDCSLGELCNAATGGCVLAADYPESCASDDDCSRGPLGETLSCDLTRSLCLPAAKCVDDQQCCGRANVVCSQTQGLCLPLQDECTPTPNADLESTCPLIPQATDECAEGLFCSNDGVCVQCQCDEDCGSPALKCRVYDGTCVSNSYCEQNADCTNDEVCKVDVNECVGRCDPEVVDSCPPQSFCDPETLFCRNNSERPCVEDSLSPNHSLLEASGISISSNDEYVNEFALCNTEPDYFALTFDAAASLQIFVSADDRLEVLYELLGADDQTVVATGFVGELGAELLSTTINTAETRILRVSALNETEGFYTLNIATSYAETCEALGDSPRNDTAETATTLWSGLTTQDCSETETNQQISYSCPINSLNLCPGDIDYYQWEVPANSQSRLAVSSSSDSLTVQVLGPVSEENEAAPTVLPTLMEGGLKVYDFSSRNAETYLISLSDPTSREALYTLSGEVTSAGSCQEDLFDEEEAANTNENFGVQDDPGQNDSQATLIYLNPGPTSVETNVCVNDIDWFSIRAEDSPQTFPRGQIIRLDWSEQVKPNLKVNGVERTLPTQFVTQENQTLDIQLSNPSADTELSGSLELNWESPAPCSTPAESTPSGAVIPALDPSETSGGLTDPEPWCGFEDRWYLFTVPADTILEVSATSQNQSLKIEFHDDSIRAIYSPTFDLPLGVSLLAEAPATISQPQTGFLSPSSQTRVIYTRVTNVSGMTDANLALDWRIFDTSCTPDENEDDDRLADANVLSWAEGGLASTGILSACPGDDDWFALSIADSATLDAQILTPTATDFTFEFYDESLNRMSWEQVSNEPGSQRLRFIPNSQNDSTYYARMRSLSPLSAYRVDFQADGVCVDDSLETTNPIELTPELTLESLKLCNDSDEFELSGLGAADWNVCVQFEHDEIDIDIQLETQSGEFIASSATKEDLESISFTSVEGEAYLLTVYSDLRSSGIGTYTVVLQATPCASQP